MILQWTQSLPQFLLWYAVASIGGCASYWALRLAPLTIRDSFVHVLMLLIVAACIATPILLLLLVLLIPLTLLGLVPSIMAAFCEKAIDKDGETWSFHLGISLLTYLFSFTVSLSAFFLISKSAYLSRFFDSALDDAPSVWGLGLGLLLTPAAISLFRWIVYNSHTRPGIDRHLREEERMAH